MQNEYDAGSNPYIEESEQVAAYEEAFYRHKESVAFAPDEVYQPIPETDTNPPPKRNLWPKIFRAALIFVVAVWVAALGGLLDHASAPKPTYQMVTQNVTVAGLQGGAKTGQNVHFTAKVERDAPGDFDFALMDDPSKPADKVVVLIPALSTVKVGQTVQVDGYDYGEFITSTGLYVLVVAEAVK